MTPIDFHVLLEGVDPIGDIIKATQDVVIKYTNMTLDKVRRTPSGFKSKVKMALDDGGIGEGSMSVEFSGKAADSNLKVTVTVKWADGTSKKVSPTTGLPHDVSQIILHVLMAERERREVLPYEKLTAGSADTELVKDKVNEYGAKEGYEFTWTIGGTMLMVGILYGNGSNCVYVTVGLADGTRMGRVGWVQATPGEVMHTILQYVEAEGLADVRRGNRDNSSGHAPDFASEDQAPGNLSAEQVALLAPVLEQIKSSLLGASQLPDDNADGIETWVMERLGDMDIYDKVFPEIGDWPEPIDGRRHSDGESDKYTDKDMDLQERVDDYVCYKLEPIIQFLLGEHNR